MGILEIVENQVIEDENFINIKYGNLNLLIDSNSGFFNATKFCSVNSKKLLFNFTQLSETKNLISQLEKNYNFSLIYKTDNCIIEDQSPVSGTYYHPILFLKLAIWISEEFYVQVAFTIHQFFNKSAERRLKLKKLLSCNVLENTPPPNFVDEISCINENKEEVKLRKINYAGFELLVNEENWFNASKFCLRYSNQNLNHIFEQKKYAKNLFDYLKSVVFDNEHEAFRESLTKDRSSPLYGKLYHPILFVRLAIEVSLEFYIKVSKIVLAHFNRDFETIEFLHQQEEKKEIKIIENTVAAELNLNHVEHNNKSIEKLNFADLFSSSSFSTSEKNLKIATDDEKIQIDNNAYNEDDDDDDDDERNSIDSWISYKSDKNNNNAAYDDNDDYNEQQKNVKFYSEYEVELIMAKHQTELNQLERQKNQQLEEEKLKEEELRIKLQQDERKLRMKLLQEKNKMIEQLTSRLENLNISIKEERVQIGIKRKREEKYDAIQNVQDLCGIGKVNCLFLVEYEKFVKNNRNNKRNSNKIIVLKIFRRQLDSLVRELLINLPKIKRLVGVYITENAISDYNKCKTELYEILRDGGFEFSCDDILGNVKLNTNDVEFTENVGNDDKFFIETEIMRILSKNFAVNLDVDVFEKMFLLYRDERRAVENFDVNFIANTDPLKMEVYHFVNSEIIRQLKIDTRRRIVK